MRFISTLLKKFLHNRRLFVSQHFKRVLPFGDYVSDRWEKARYLGFGEHTTIYDASLVLGDVKVGQNCWIGPFTILDGSGGGLSIGDYCDISAGVHIYTHDTVERVIANQAIVQASVRIGNHCYIGPHTVIAKGVSIGDYVVIGAHSFVNKDIPSYSKGHGRPFRVTQTIKPSDTPLV